jgi:hypothetical protein
MLKNETFIHLLFILQNNLTMFCFIAIIEFFKSLTKMNFKNVV